MLSAPSVSLIVRPERRDEPALEHARDRPEAFAPSFSTSVPSATTSTARAPSGAGPPAARSALDVQLAQLPQQIARRRVELLGVRASAEIHQSIRATLRQSSAQASVSLLPRCQPSQGTREAMIKRRRAARPWPATRAGAAARGPRRSARGAA